MSAVADYELYLFDLDGVLVDSRRVMETAWRAVQLEHGVDAPFSAYFAHIGRPFDDIMRRMGLAHHMPRIGACYEAAAHAALALGAPYPGVAQVLGELRGRGAKLGVVTSKGARRTKATLESIDLAFTTVRTPAPGVRGKPAPDLLLLAMVDAGVDPEATVFVGDMAVDYEAARRARVDFAHAAWGYGRVPDGCASIATIQELVALTPRAGASVTEPTSVA